MTADHTHACRDCGTTVDVACQSDAECYWGGGSDGCTECP